MRVKNRVWCAIVGGSLLLSACRAGGPQPNTGAPIPAPSSTDIAVYESPPAPQLRVEFTRDCVSPVPKGPEEAAVAAALLAVVVPRILEAGFGFLSAKLEEMAKPEPVRFAGIGEAYAYQRLETGNGPARAARIVSALEGACLQVGVVERSSDQTAVDQVWQVDLPRAVSRATDPAAATTSGAIKTRVAKARAGFEPTDRPYLFAEVGFRVSTDQSAFAFRPQFIYLDRPLPGGANAAPRFLSIGLAAVGKDPFGLLHLGVPPIGPRTAVGAAELNRNGYPWMALPRPPKYLAAAAAETGAPAGYQLDLPQTGPLVNVSAEIVEPREPKKWLLALSKLIGDSKADLAKAVAGEILPPTAADELAAEKGEMTLNQALNVAKATARAACAAWKAKVDAGGDGLAEWAAVLKARYDANIAAVELGVPLPFANPDDQSCP